MSAVKTSTTDHEDTADVPGTGELLLLLSDRVLDLERRLAAAGIDHVEPIDRQRRFSRARLASTSPTARYLAQREEVLG